MTDEYMRKDERYSDYMKDVDPIRKKTFNVFYDLHRQKTGMTKHAINEILVKIGIQEYNRELGEDNKTVEDIRKSMNEIYNLTFTETLSVIQDRGLMVLLKEEFGTDNAYDFLHKVGVNPD
jgi:hypothetical protein